jgi:hypothetical protein
MGALAEVFVATPSAAKQYGISFVIDPKAHRKKYAPYTARGLSALELSHLWSIIAEEAWHREHHVLEHCGSQEMNLKGWLERIGELQSFTDLFSAASRGQKPDWSKRDSEFALYRFPDEYVSLLADLAGVDERQVAVKWRSRLKRNFRSQLSETQARNVVIALANFAETVLASKKRKGLYVWTSL